MLYSSFQKLPQNALLFLYGFVFCFFGGTFPTLFAAIQAAEYGGREAFVKAIGDLSDEALIIIEESKKDNDEDKNNDGKKDVDQISSSEFMVRKTKVRASVTTDDKFCSCSLFFVLFVVLFQCSWCFGK